MAAGYYRVAGAALLVQVWIGGSPSFAQGNQPWVDPPADLVVPRGQDAPANKTPPQPDASAPVRRAPSAPPSLAAPPPAAGYPAQERGTLVAARERAAADLARRYLQFWSAPNEIALEATPDFYAGRVAFHGRMLSIGALLEEKRRFVQRWPERHYQHRRGAMHVHCEQTGASCTIRSLFDFAAASAQRGKRSRGTASLELVIEFDGDRPVIVSENSDVRNWGGSSPAALLEGAPDE